MSFFPLSYCRRHLVAAEQRAAQVGAAAAADRGGEAQDGADHGQAKREGRKDRILQNLQGGTNVFFRELA